MSKQRPGMPRTIARRQQQIEAAELRAAGLSWQEVAERTGYKSAGSARGGALRVIERATQEASDDLINLEINKLDQLHKAVWPKAVQGDHKAVQDALAIMQRRAKFLGLDQAENQIATAVEKAAGTLEQQTALVAVAVDRVLRQLDLTDTQWARVPTLMARELGT